MFTQPDYSNFRAREEQSLNPAMPHESTSAAADEVKHLSYTYCFLVKTLLEILTILDKELCMYCYRHANL